MNFIDYLMRGGTYGYYWTKQSTTTYWWKVGERPDPPNTEEDIYFGVHPTDKRKDSKSRALIQDIQAINCLYSDFDLKDYQEDKGLIAAHIRELNPPPSVIIDSGGGYHCYWLLKEPFLITSDLTQQIASDLQRSWVAYVKGDLAVHDLARIMRVPGTSNYKYDPPRPVMSIREVYSDAATWDLAELQELLPETNTHRGEEVEEQIVPQPVRPNDLSEQEIVDLALDSPNRDKFLRLFRGISSDYESESEADLAFCRILAFWSGGDYLKMDRLFRASDRMRPKWERYKYRHETLTKAILKTEDFYTDPYGLLTAGAHDEGNASVTFGRVKDKIAYCEALGWLRYTKGYWETELAEPAVEDEIVEALKARRMAAAEVQNESVMKASRLEAPSVMRTKTLLKRKVAVGISEFDTSLDELNCPNGVLDLRTGKLSPHHWKKRFTYCLPVRYIPGADQTFWTQWLLHTTGGKQEIVDYLQTAVGYTLTGRVREEVMFYIYGPARAGKGVFTETLIAMLGGRPLATEVDIDMFMTNSNSSSIGFSLAALKAARFVAASESRENEWINAKNVKRWTGRNYITCAHKYGRDFTYQPQFKIWLTSNFPLQMDADDAAAWGRVRLLEFPISHMGHEDKMLKSKMLEPRVLEGILAWAVEGSIKWYQTKEKGLQTPKEVEVNVQEAHSSVDFVTSWLEEQVEVTNNEEDIVPSDVYYPEYEDWCKDNGVHAKSLRSLNKSLKRLDVGLDVSVVKRVGGATKRCWVGVRVNGYRQGLSRIKKMS